MLDALLVKYLLSYADCAYEKNYVLLETKSSDANIIRKSCIVQQYKSSGFSKTFLSLIASDLNGPMIFM